MLTVLVLAVFATALVSCHHDQHSDDLEDRKIESTEGNKEVSSQGKEVSSQPKEPSKGGQSQPAPEPQAESGNGPQVKKVSFALPSSVDADSSVVFSTASFDAVNTFTYQAASQLASVNVKSATDIVDVDYDLVKDATDIIISYQSNGTGAEGFVSDEAFTDGDTVLTVDLDLINGEPLARRLEKQNIEPEEKKLGILPIVLTGFPVAKDEVKNKSRDTWDITDVKLTLDGVEMDVSDTMQGNLLFNGTEWNFYLDFTDIECGNYSDLELTFKHNGKDFHEEHHALSRSDATDFDDYYVNQIRVDENGNYNVWIRCSEAPAESKPSTVKLVFQDSNDYDEVSLYLVGENRTWAKVSTQKEGDGHTFVFDSVPSGDYKTAVIRATSTIKPTEGYQTTNRTTISYKGEVYFQSDAYNNSEEIEAGKENQITLPHGTMHPSLGMVTFDSYFAVKVENNVEKGVEDGSDQDDANKMTVTHGPTTTFEAVSLSFTPFESQTIEKDGVKWKIYHVQYHILDSKNYKAGVMVGWMTPGNYELKYNGQDIKVSIGSGENVVTVVGTKAKELLGDNSPVK